MLLCLCHAVSDRRIRQTVRDGVTTVGEIARATRAGTGCGSCKCDLKRILHEAKGRGQRVEDAIFEIPPIKHRPRKGRGLTVSELHELASWFPEHASRLILLAGQVGCRQNVWFNLTDEMFDLRGGTLTIPAALAKRRCPNGAGRRR